jgi:hypothetical protein
MREEQYTDAEFEAAEKRAKELGLEKIYREAQFKYNSTWPMSPQGMLAIYDAGASSQQRKPGTDEVFRGVMDCIKAVKKLDAGQSIIPRSPEHEALIWGVLRLAHENLIDHSPLTGADLAFAQEVARKYAECKYEVDADGEESGKESKKP